MVSTTIITTVLLVLFIAAATAGRKFIKPRNETVWFPNPDTNSPQQLIPAHLYPPTSGGEMLETDLSKVHFMLYTKDNPIEGDELFLDDPESISNSHFKQGGPLKFMSHGFGGGIDHTFPWATQQEYLKFDDENMNIILLDWSELAASPEYYTAVQNCYAVSNHSADFLAFLIAQEITTVDQIHLIGFSLGGQLVGITANRFTRLTGEVFPRITSLDPAFPLFDNGTAEDDDRISKDDGVFVDVVHTAGGTLGLTIPRGHVDFYPNGGIKQPGCGTDPVGSCSHGRAPAFFTESIFGTIPFTSCSCESWEEWNNGTCGCLETNFLGHWVDQGKPGKYFLITNEEPPYAIGDETVKIVREESSPLEIQSVEFSDELENDVLDTIDIGKLESILLPAKKVGELSKFPVEFDDDSSWEDEEFFVQK